MKLVVTEKNIAAKKLAEILATGKPKTSKVSKTAVYTFQRDGEDWMSIGLKGHVLGVDFPRQIVFDDGAWDAVWEDGALKAPVSIPESMATPPWPKKRPFTTNGVDLKAWKLAALPYLVWAPIGKTPAERELIRALKSAARKSDEIVVATDFDREGELIGSDAAALVREVNKKAPIKRARFSALTKSEVVRAFDELVTVDDCLAQAGESRQDIDLVWGAVLTRYLTVAKFTGFGNVKSAGRVQTPTLALIVEREREREAFVPEVYWTVKGAFRSRGAEPSDFAAPHATSRFRTEADAARVMDAVAGKTSGTVTAAEKKRRTVKPPAPFSTTSLQAAAAAEGLTPGRTMRVAESLYMDGLISYPRVDNTVYPESLDLHAILEALQGVAEFRTHAAAILSGPLHPTRGAKETTDHPPIHPTGAADQKKLKPEAWKLYNLVARRFLATLSDAAVVEGTTVTVEVGGEPFVAKGDVLVVPGFRRVYPFGLKKDEQLPALHEHEEVDFLGAAQTQKATEPPARYSQGKLIQEMEKRGLGTKATRHAIIERLFEGQVRGRRAAATDEPGPRRDRCALDVRAAHHNAGHDLRARGRDGRDCRRRQDPYRGGHALASAAGAGDERPAPQGGRGRRDAQGRRCRRCQGGRLPEVGSRPARQGLPQDAQPVRRLLGLAGLRCDLSVTAGQDRSGAGALPGLWHTTGQGHSGPQQAARRVSRPRLRDQPRARGQRGCVLGVCRGGQARRSDRPPLAAHAEALRALHQLRGVPDELSAAAAWRADRDRGDLRDVRRADGRRDDQSWPVARLHRPQVPCSPPGEEGERSPRAGILRL